MVHYVCNKDTVHNGTRYRKGQCWDGDLPAPQVGDFWSILQYEEPDSGLQHDGIVTSSSRGGVGWKIQPDRPRAQPASLTPEEKEQLAIDPYASLEEAPAPPPPADPVPPDSEKKQQPTISSHLLMTREEIDDPFGLRARAAAQTAELKKDSPVDPPDKK